jgi:tRNA(adenine34) deaminase
MNDDEKYMHIAQSVAEEGLERGELPIGAIVVLGNRVIASAHTTAAATGKLLVHADLQALLQADERGDSLHSRRRMTLFVNLEPCLMCFGAAMSAAVGAVVYGLESPSDGATRLAREWTRAEEDFPDYRVPEVREGVLRDMTVDLFRKYVRVHDPDDRFTAWARTIARI